MKIRKPFHFKKFSIEQASVTMPVTTDACIFGAIISAQQPQSILDIGTGSGLLALMMAQKIENAGITAIELDADTLQQADSNFKKSAWSDRITAVHGDILTYNPAVKFDLIVCNPPFFSNQLASESGLKRQARHLVTLNYAGLTRKCADLLDDEGTLWLLIPLLHRQSVIDIVGHFKLFLAEETQISANETKTAHVTVLKFSRNNASVQYNTLSIHDESGAYTAEMKALLADFYL